MSALDDLFDGHYFTDDPHVYIPIDEARKELAALRQRTEWQPIGVNPMVVGIRYLVFSEGQGISFAYYWGLGEWQGCGFQPTHWMPLPELP